MDLKDYWHAVRTGWKIIVASVVLALLAGAVLAWTATPQYESSTRLFVAAQVDSQDVEELYERNAIARDRVASYVAVASGSTLAEEVSDALGTEFDPAAVSASVVPGTVVMQIAVTDSDRERARDIARTYAELLPETVRGLEQVGDATAAQVQLRVIDEAALAESPVSPSPLRNLVLSFVLGLFAGLGLAVLLHVLRREAAPSSEAPAHVG